MGMLAAQTVLRQISAPASAIDLQTIHAQQIVVDPELVVRESTCPAAVATRARKKR
jgi:DNA-binding LacI/PurR family transcriptional regulator